ncbi:hypothetical protein SynA1825c_01856 [Synechococcus sp. A18-25c]|nr:hypothetical protein SynA1560_01873 [Synechococcus sp. A15-60]QNJ20157.1 hypothetical protein SynA1825c_01856 [Synechococcus sp. A18-25c]
MDRGRASSLLHEFDPPDRPLIAHCWEAVDGATQAHSASSLLLYPEIAPMLALPTGV